MTVYHFINEKFGREDLKNKHLKISRITELIDPFELLPVNLSDPYWRRAMEDTKEELSKDRGILCFCKDWNNPVQWAHYAERFRGLCFGFDIDNIDNTGEPLLMKVNYVEKRLLPPSKGEFKRMNLDEKLKLTRECLTTKFKHWEYENEYRVFSTLDPKDKINGMYFSNFSDILKLKQVIIGFHSKITPAEINKALGDMASRIEIFKARPSFSSFKIVR